MFIGREAERSELENRWNSDRFEMGVVYGSRRIGKTSLLREFCSNKHAFYFQCRLEDEKGNLYAFSKAWHTFLGLPGSGVFSSFDDALEEIAAHAQTEKMILVLDEVSYLCAKGQGMLSTLQYFIDHRFSRGNMMLLLSGSNISFMKELLNDGNNPLYQRATFRIHVRKMPFEDALLFVKALPPRDRVDFLSLFGPHPYYLSMIDPEKSFSDNVRTLFYTRYGTLVDAPAKVLPAGTTHSPIYQSLLKTIAGGKRFSKEIAEAVGQSPNYISPYLSHLVDNQIIEKRESFVRNKKTNYYALSDSLLKFWYRFIFDKQEMIEQGYGESLFLSDREGIADCVARNFEDVALLWLESQNRQGKLPCLFEPARNYIVEKSQLGRSIELDGLAEGYGSNAHRLLVVECKYRSQQFNIRMLNHLKESVSIFDRYTEIDYYLFSGSGFSDEISNMTDPRIHLITPEIMCNPGDL